jgi:hypothetical protein
VHADLETLAIALYVKVDDDLKTRPELVKPRPPAGIAPKLSDAEMVTMAVMQALLNIRSERRWLRYMGKHLRHLFPYQPKQPGYNKRLRATLPLIKHVIRVLAMDTDFWFDNHWILDSTPVECGRSRPTVQRSNAAGWAVRLLRLALPLLLGITAIPDLHPHRHAHPVGTGRREDRRAGGCGSDARPRGTPA